VQVWVDEVVRGLRVWLGNDAFFQFFEPGWSGKPLPEIVAGRAATCLARYVPIHILIQIIRLLPQDVYDTLDLIVSYVSTVIAERERIYPASPRAEWTRVE
jgi:hypothetical protein